jgi:membrane protein implicated in regulation of membrane protease activity
MFGIAGYLLTRHGALGPIAGTVVAAALALAWSALVTRLAIATARLQPDHDPEDPRYLLQGRIGVVTVAIPAGGEGMIRYEDNGQLHTVRARDIGDGAIAADEEICIDRVEDDVAHVEPWKLVEQRL